MENKNKRNRKIKLSGESTEKDTNKKTIFSIVSAGIIFIVAILVMMYMYYLWLYRQRDSVTVAQQKGSESVLDTLTEDKTIISSNALMVDTRATDEPEVSQKNVKTEETNPLSGRNIYFSVLLNASATSSICPQFGHTPHVIKLFFS